MSADRDKVTRASAVTPMIEAGRVLLPESAPFLDEYLDELSVFPASKNDDWTDSTVQALNWLRGTAGGFQFQSWINYFSRKVEEAEGKTTPADAQDTSGGSSA